jgi:hypothetical protein
MDKTTIVFRTILGATLILFGIAVLISVFMGAPLFVMGADGERHYMLGTTSGIGAACILVGAVLVEKNRR